MPLDREKMDRVKDYVKSNKAVLRLAAILVAVVLITAHIRGCQRANVKEPEHPRPVQTAISVKKDVPLFVDSFGTLEALNSVDIKAQITGKIKDINFEQGQSVKSGDLLFTIDPVEYKAKEDKATAQLEQDKVELKLKQDTLSRNEKLFEKNLISQQDIEQYRTEVTAAEALVALDTANLELAKIDLGYCCVTSPIDGVTGKRLLDKGNIVSANSGPTLVNVRTMDELYADFTLSERDLPKVRRSMSAGTLKVRITVDGDGDQEYFGELELVDNSINDKTGTMALRAVVSNGNRALWPGQFVRIRLILGEEKGAVIVPYSTVQLGKKGYYAFVVTKDDKADLREVTAGDIQDNDIIVEKGIEEGETVVTSGQMGLAPGVSVIDVTDKLKEAAAKAGMQAAKEK